MSARDVTPEELNRLRIALDDAVLRTSLRAVAADVGMSPTGLSQFIDGARPRGKTIELVRSWYQQQAGLGAVRADEIARQLRRIVGTLPEPDNGVADLLDAVERSYKAADAAAPEWVERVRALIGARSAPKRDPAAAVLRARNTA